VILPDLVRHDRVRSCRRARRRPRERRAAVRDADPEGRARQLVTDRRAVTEVTFTTAEDRARLKARLGKPRITGDGE